MNLSRRVIVGAVTGIGMRGVGVICQLILTAMTMRAWSSAQFGLWSLVLSTTLLLSIFDFGVSSALQNRLAARQGDVPRYYWASFTLFFTLSLLITAVAMKVVHSVDWNQYVGMDASAIMQTLFAIVVLKQPLGLCRGLYFARQRADIVALIEGSVVVLSVAMMGHAIFWEWSFQAAVISYLFVQIVPWVIAQITLFFSLPFTVITLREAWKIVVELAGPALGLWLLNLFSLCIISTDDWIISQVIGIESVGHVVNLRRLFNLILMINWAVLTPMWSAYTASHVQGDIEWIWTGLKRSIATTLSVVLIGGSFLFFAHPLLLEVWTGFKMADFPLALSLWAVTFVLSLNASLSTLLNGIGIVRLQVIANGIAAVINILLSVYWGRVAGVVGIVCATAVVFAALSLFNAFLIARVVKP